MIPLGTIFIMATLMPLGVNDARLHKTITKLPSGYDNLGRVVESDSYGELMALGGGCRHLMLFQQNQSLGAGFEA